MKRTGVVVGAVCLVLSAVVAIGSPAEAAPKTFRNVTVKVIQEYAQSHDDWSTPTAVLCVGVVHWEGGGTDHSCPTYAQPSEFVPSVRSFKVTFRWFAGRRIIRKTTRTVANHNRPILVDAPTRHLTGSLSAASGAWRWKGKPLSLTVTMSKKGHATKVVRVANKEFTYVDD